MQALEVRRVPSSSDLLHPGEYVFIPKRDPKIAIERQPLTPPTGFVNRALWNCFGKKYEMKQILELISPEIDTIIINCPTCNTPCATTNRHKILSVEPLTLEIPLTCPYCKDVTFFVKAGKLSIA
jgi:hypothetical protein